MIWVLTFLLTRSLKLSRLAFIGKAGRDYAASRGEYLNGIVLAKYLGYNFVDAADVIYFNDQGQFDSARTNEVLPQRLATP